MLISYKININIHNIEAVKAKIMKQIIFTILLGWIYSQNYGQTREKESKLPKGVPIMFVDSAQINEADLQK